MINTYIYALSFIALSGFGIVFLNAESILAICFFVFFAFIIRYAEPATEGLDLSRQGIRDQLVETMSHDAIAAVEYQQQSCFEKITMLGNS